MAADTRQAITIATTWSKGNSEKRKKNEKLCRQSLPNHDFCIRCFYVTKSFIEDNMTTTSLIFAQGYHLRKICYGERERVIKITHFQNDDYEGFPVLWEHQP